MISQTVIKKYGLDAESLKKLFTDKKLINEATDHGTTPGQLTDKKKKKEHGLKPLITLIRDRIKDGRERSLRDYRIWAAVDLAYDAPFHQETPTLIRHILDTCTTEKEMLSACRSWGLCEGDMFCKVKKSDGNTALELNAPVFFGVFVPVVRAYVAVRLGKLFNDRNLIPLLKYEPQKYTEENRIRCEIITDIVQAISTAFGYGAVLRQQIFQALLYSCCLMFPVEPWYVEEQEGEDGKDHIEKEGVRYLTPHITRTFMDMTHAPSTFNTDSGCTFGGYWSINKWGDVDRNEQYWNKERISYGYNWMDKKQPWANYFEQAYPCTMEFPSTGRRSKVTDRESIADSYSSTDYDKAIFLTHIFMKLKPKEWGLGDYKHPVWFRFIVAADDTVIYAEALSYSPIIFTGYDADMNRGRNASLALEILPWQDHLGNILTQILLTIKRNLANVIFYDVHQVDGEVLAKLQRRSQWQYQQLNFIGRDAFKDKLANAGRDAVPDAIHEVKFAFADTSQMTTAISTVISIMERLLVISPQEIGSAASHQQSKAEIVTINANTTNRVTYTGSFVDDAQDAWKRQLYDACRAHMDAEGVAAVSSDIPEVEKHIKAMGFEVMKTDTGNTVGGRQKILVKYKLAGLRLEGFASTREGPNRGNDKEAAQAILMTVQSINQNPALAAAVDPRALAHMMEIAARLYGADRDFKIPLNRDAMTANRLQQVVEQIQAGVQQMISNEMKPAAEAISEQAQVNQQQSEQINGLTQNVGQLSKLVEELTQMIGAAAAAPPLQPPSAVDQGLPPVAIPPEPIPAGAV